MEIEFLSEILLPSNITLLTQNNFDTVQKEEGDLNNLTGT